MVRTALIVILLLTPLTRVMPLWAQDQKAPPPEDVERIIEEILRLRGEADALLEALSPEIRDEVERRWKELQASPPESLGVGEPEPASSIADSPEPDDTVSVPGEVGATAVPEPELEPEAEDQSTATSEMVSEPEPEPEPEPAKECDSLGPLDTNGDGVISASDRNWRYLRLRADTGGRSTNMVDLESLYDLDIREIDVNLRFYKLSDGAAGDVFIDDRIRFELLSKRKSSRRSMILFIQASRLARSGELRLVDPSGALLAGDQPLAPGVALQTAEGKRLPLLCP